jgi:hypothetical protein
MTKDTKQLLDKWEYEIFYKENGRPILKVRPDPNLNITKPKTLAKYYPLTQNSLNAFINDSFYLAQPDNFNDLFDFSPLAIDFSAYEFVDFENLFHVNKRKIELEKYNLNANKYKNDIKDDFYRSWVQMNGILCLTKNVDNDLMWAHYTNNEGFLLEFDLAKLPINYLGPFPINYVKERCKVKFNRNIDVNLGLFIEALIKKKIWDYEDEYRLFFYPEDINKYFQVNGIYSNESFEASKIERYISYSNDAISKIVLGFNFLGKDITKVNDYQYIIDLKHENSPIKYCILSKVIRENINTELLFQDFNDYSLKTIPVKIKYAGGTKFEVLKARIEAG